MHSDHRYTIHRHQHHFGWNNAIEPVQYVEAGSTVTFSCLDSSGGQITAQSDLSNILALDFDRLNPVNGPVFVDGAEPGDALKITFDSFAPSGVGWTANIPGFGLLADQFKEPALNIWRYDPVTLAPAMFGTNARVPLKPFTGTIGTAMAQLGQHSVVPPRAVGGNLDVRDLSAGTVLYLPVAVAGALLSVGDTHAAQGDGEVCGTAIESAMDVTLKIELVKDARLAMPRFTTPGPVTRHLDHKGYEVTTGVGDDLMQCARVAVAQMIELLARRYHIDPVEAYMLCSACGDLRISEIVDIPNWVISFYFPRCVFE